MSTCVTATWRRSAYRAKPQHRHRSLSSENYSARRGTRCTGVRYGQCWTTARSPCPARSLFSGGSIDSPQLLELSGIGQPELLRRHRDRRPPRTAPAARRKSPRPLSRPARDGRSAPRATPSATGAGDLDWSAEALPRHVSPAKGCLEWSPRRSGPCANARRPRQRPTSCSGGCRCSTQPPGAADCLTVGHDVLCPSDAPREHKGSNPYHVGRSVDDAAGHRFHFSVGAGRCGIDGDGHSGSTLDHDGARDGAASGIEVAPGTPLQTDDEIIEWVKAAAESHPIIRSAPVKWVRDDDGGCR